MRSGHDLRRWAAKRTAHVTGVLGTRLLRSVLPLLSRRTLARLALAGARLAWCFGLRERRRTLAHLRIAFPGRRARWRARTGREVFERAAQAGAETVHVGLVDRAGLPRVVDTRELRALLAARRPGDCGWVLLTPHLGPFILQAAHHGRTNPLEIVARPARVGYIAAVEREMFDELGIVVHEQGSGLRRLARLVRQGTAIGMAPDHDIRRLAGAFVPFFGRLAYTPTGPAALARLAGARLGVVLAVPVSRRRPGGPSHVTRVEEIPQQRSGDASADLLENTRRWMALVEAYIRAYPAEWTWMNRRWRTRPADNPRAPVWNAAALPAAWRSPPVRPA